MNSSSWIRTTFPALAEISDAEMLTMLKAIERESGIYILTNVYSVWLLIFLGTEQIADLLGIEFFRDVGGWMLILVAIALSAVISRTTHKRLIAYLIEKKLSTA